MAQQNFYDRIIDDKATYDKVVYDLEKMIQDAPNPRIRTQAELARTYLIQVQQICDALKKHNEQG